MVHLIPGTLLLTVGAHLARAHGALDPEALPGAVLLLPLAFVLGFLVQLAPSAFVGLVERTTGRWLDPHVGAEERKDAPLAPAPASAPSGDAPD